ncbi:MAG: hypothetical protein WCK49_10410, partial [Myxococcaceae bacterium]
MNFVKISIVSFLSLINVAELLASVPPGRYADVNGGPISQSSQQVLDTVTGLVWQRGCSDPISDSTTGAPVVARAY